MHNSKMRSTFKCIQVKKRLSRGKTILEEMQRDADKVFVLSDEKFFNLEAVVNYQNDNAYVTSTGNISEGVRTHFKRRKVTGIMVYVGCF